VSTVLKGQKFSVTRCKQSRRLDCIKVAVISASGKKASHHITPEEAKVFAFALTRASQMLVI